MKIVKTSPSLELMTNITQADFLTNYATILDDENQKTENMNLIKVHKKWM